MSRNFYSEIYLHIVWHTKNSSPLLTATVEPIAHRCLKDRILKTPDVFLHEIGGTETHVHVAVTVPPTLTLSDWIGQLKGGSSHDVNQEVGKRQKVLQWQAGYGVVSFGKKDLPWVTNYIRDQRDHHARKTAHDRLEQISPPGA
ncbi:MAG: IS200/IS605 family transposase [Planctomycetales bacterium]|nr:IS200/IS605 family transposase [Planctomycetales bacterium]NIM07808.1 IS200/IS605 family transposase [Planctomycetales bacterium]NIN07300.1 IS200/IS605 family transposase [Planctomycetales bacterium]NIN76400.1 IS200/IS605 family transposase [Planctomycetales bacterium]NIO33599.1 IS200/IS605 family transposase [Planctomycetales bacterium]